MVNNVTFDWLNEGDTDAAGGTNPDTAVDSSRPLLALILAPTRELAIQVNNHIKDAAKYTDIKVCITSPTQPALRCKESSLILVHRRRSSSVLCVTLDVKP